MSRLIDPEHCKGAVKILEYFLHNGTKAGVGVCDEGVWDLGVATEHTETHVLNGRITTSDPENKRITPYGETVLIFRVGSRIILNVGPGAAGFKIVYGR